MFELLITKSYLMSKYAHAALGQLRKGTQVPYHTHPYEVARILSKAGFSTHVVAAGAVHDVLEDTLITPEFMARELGWEVTNLVIAVSSISKSEDGNRKFRKEKDHSFWAKGTYESQSIKVADILSNTKDIENLSDTFGILYLKENLQLLGMLDKAHAQLRAMATAQVLKKLRLLECRSK